MKRCVPLFVLCFVALTLSAATDPFLGNWKLDPSRSKLPDKMKVEHVSGDRYAFDFGGGAETIAVDGSDQPGVLGTTLAVTAAGPDAWKVVRKKNGRTVISAAWRLSKDGNTITDTFSMVDPNGPGATVEYIYRRTAGGSGFVGTWESTTITKNSAFVLKVEPFDGDGLSFVDPFEGETKSVKFDGKDYPNVAPNMIEGLACAARRVDDSTLELTEKYKGRTVDTQTVQLSPDRRTLTVTMSYPGQHDANVMVFQR